MIYLSELHEEISTIAPIVGLSFGEDLRVDFAPEATEEQKELVLAFLPDLILSSAKKVKIAALSGECEKAIVSGFTSTALGTPHHYNAQYDNQMNLSILGLAGLDADYTCTDLATGVKAQRFHLAAQIHQVFLDGLAHKAGLMKKFGQLRSLVEAASTTEEVEAIVW